MKVRIAVIGAGLCGSVLGTLLRNDFEVTVVEQGRRKRPLFGEIDCRAGEINASINRGAGLGGTTNYWHNALIEMSDTDLHKAGILSGSLEPYYSRAWELFLSADERRECARIRDANRAAFERGRCSLAHMVLPRRRANAWTLANARHPGDEIRVVYGAAQRIVPGGGSAPGHVIVDTGAGLERVEADHVIVCAGGLATPALLARSLGADAAFCPGYHDHAMAYIAKVRLRPDSRLRAMSCTVAGATEVRAGLVFESAGLKAAFYLRPALDLGLRAIQGPARYVLSDLRNDPWSPKKIVQLLTNIEALREAVLFKTKAGFRGDYYSILLMGEQTADAARGMELRPGKKPLLNWLVTTEERRAYHASFARFLDEFADDLLETNAIEPEQWEFRTAAHHSGAAQRFLADPGDLGLDFFSVKGLPGSYVCDGSLLRASGIANSGLTLVALSHRLAELIAASAPASSLERAIAAGRALDAVGV